jgi:hypothetical protein
MKRILSLANRPKLERQENPKSARVKKNRPKRFWNPAISFLREESPSIKGSNKRREIHT